jgi:hypothetical protein
LPATSSRSPSSSVQCSTSSSRSSGSALSRSSEFHQKRNERQRLSSPGRDHRP